MRYGKEVVHCTGGPQHVRHNQRFGLQHRRLFFRAEDMGA